MSVSGWRKHGRQRPREAGHPFPNRKNRQGCLPAIQGRDRRINTSSSKAFIVRFCLKTNGLKYKIKSLHTIVQAYNPRTQEAGAEGSPYVWYIVRLSQKKKANIMDKWVDEWMNGKGKQERWSDIMDQISKVFRMCYTKRFGLFIKQRDPHKIPVTEEGSRDCRESCQCLGPFYVSTTKRPTG